jgi:TM2 domain-containing membrane protein YozV
MKFKISLALAIFSVSALAQAAPSFWNVPNATPTPPEPPVVQEQVEPLEFLTATPTAVMAPMVQIPTATPTPLAGLKPLNPTQAAIFSLIIPGAGQVYAGDPAKGIAIAALFGVGLWQTLDNFQLIGNGYDRNDEAGNLFGFATLVVYGFGIQDAFNTATAYNKKNYLAFQLGINPEPNLSLAYKF